MVDHAGILNQLVKLGTPSWGRRWWRSFVRSFDVLLMLLPFVALSIRMTTAEVEEPREVWLALVAGAFTAATILAALFLLRRSVDLLVAARRADELGNTKELFLTLACARVREHRGPLLPFLMKRAEDTLPALKGAPVHLPAVSLKGWKRDAAALILTFLILLIPALPKGALGPKLGLPDDAPGGTGGGSHRGNSGQALHEGQEPAKERSLADLIDVRVKSDRRIYLPGEEITLTVTVRTRVALSSPPALSGLALLDGEVTMPLPLENSGEVAPDAGASRTFDLKIRDRLKALGRYRRGLLAIDSQFFSKSDDRQFGGTVPGNRVVIQISENARDQQARSPRPPPPPAPRPKPKPPQKKGQKKGRRQAQKPRPVATPGPGKKAPQKIDSSPVVVEPLFSGDQTKKRQVRVYDRSRTDGEPPPQEARPEATRRDYRRVTEAELRGLMLDQAEKRLVRRYLEAVRQKSGSRK